MESTIKNGVQKIVDGDITHYAPAVGFVKRPDLDGYCCSSSPENWKWWITALELEIRDNSENRVSEALEMADYLELINSTPDPLTLIEFFCKCHEWKVYPPGWVMDDLYNRFSEYLTDNYSGKARKLGEYFGEPSRGNRSAHFRQKAMEWPIISACMAVDRLHHCYRIPKTKARELANYRMQSLHPVGIFREKGIEGLTKSYSKWRKTDHYQLYRMTLLIGSIGDEADFLKSFPPESLLAYPRLEKIRDKKRVKHPH
jgi:hypothetical protein